MTTSTRTSRTAAVLLILGLTAITSQAQETCRQGANKLPHQQNLWQDDFPINEKPEALCEGSVVVKTDGEICITGRVSYAQLAEKVGRPIRAPASGTISVQGHLISGTGNVILGSESGFVYDYVTSYSIGDTTYTAGPDIANNLFAASKGLITGVCFDKSFAKDEEFYAISHDIWLPGGADETKFTEANVIYASFYSVVAEYHKATNLGPFFGTITNTLVTFAASLIPGFLFRFLPLVGATGIARYFVAGSMSTASFPQPLQAPDTIVADIQIDTEWSTLMSAMSDGLFTDDMVPLYFGVLIKKIEASATSNGCWKTTAAAIDIQAPPGWGNRLDKYVNDEVFPALKARGNVTIHMGKRLDSGSAILKSAMDVYGACGVELDLTPENCYHPACTRSATGMLTGFEYPNEYYQTRSKGYLASENVTLDLA